MLEANIGMNRQGIQHLDAIPSFEGELQNPTPLQVRESFDLSDEHGPFLAGQPEEIARQPAPDLCEVKDQEGPLVDIDCFLFRNCGS